MFILCIVIFSISQVWPKSLPVVARELHCVYISSPERVAPQPCTQLHGPSGPAIAYAIHKHMHLNCFQLMEESTGLSFSLSQPSCSWYAGLCLHAMTNTLRLFEDSGKCICKSTCLAVVCFFLFDLTQNKHSSRLIHLQLLSVSLCIAGRADFQMKS